MKKFYDFARAGAELEFTIQKFDRLAEAIGSTGDAMREDLAEATDGLMSDAEQMELATEIMALGLVDTADQTVRLSKVVSQLGADMNQVTLTLANRTTMRFDQIGIAIEGFDDRLQGLVDSGMDVEKAFTEAFIQQGEAQIEKVGSISETSAGKMMQFEVAIKNLSDAFAMSLIPDIIKGIEAITTFLTLGEQEDEVINQIVKGASSYESYTAAFDRLNEQTHLNIATTEEYARIMGIGGLGAAFTTAKGLVVILTEEEFKLQQQFQDTHEFMRLQNLEMGTVATVSKTATDEMLGFSQAELNSLGATEALGDELLKGLNPAIKDNAEAAAEAALAEQAFDTALGNVNRNILNQIENWQKNIEWITSGAYALQQEAEALMENVHSGEDYEEVANRLAFVQDLIIQKAAELDNMSMADIQEAYEKIGYETEQAAIKAAELYYQNLDINEVSLDDITQSLYDMGIPWAEAEALAAAILSHLRAIDGTTASAKIVIDTYNNQHGAGNVGGNTGTGASYGGGSSGGAGAGSGNPLVNQQAGGNFIVPPYPVRATAGERVQVTPKSETMSDALVKRADERRRDERLARLIGEQILIGMS